MKRSWNILTNGVRLTDEARQAIQLRMETMQYRYPEVREFEAQLNKTTDLVLRFRMKVDGQILEAQGRPHKDEMVAIGNAFRLAREWLEMLRGQTGGLTQEEYLKASDEAREGRRKARKKAGGSKGTPRSVPM